MRGLAAPAHADDDTDFANQLHPYGIYGPRDYNAWLGKIVRDRLHKRVDTNAFESTHFVADNMLRGAIRVQTWQFLGTASPTTAPTRRRSWKTLRRSRGDYRATSRAETAVRI